MNKAKQVVETWDEQLLYSPREQRLVFLYLASDILQNSRRKGSEFVGEFWKVLPNALGYVIENGDGFSKNAALRLAAQSQSEQTGNLCRRFLNNNEQLLVEQIMNETRTSKVPHSFITGNGEQSAPVMYTWMVPPAEKPGEDPKAAAAAMAAKLTTSTASAQMLSYVLSFLASEGVIGNPIKESSRDFSSEKRTKLDNDHHSSKVLPQNSQPPVPPYPHPDSIHHSIPITHQELTANEPPSVPSSPPPLPSGSVPYGYGTAQHKPPPMPGYPSLGSPVSGVSPFTAPPSYTYQSFQGSEGGFYSQPASM